METKFLRNPLLLILLSGVLTTMLLPAQTLSWGDWAIHLAKLEDSDKFGRMSISSVALDPGGNVYLAGSFRRNDYRFGEDTLRINNQLQGRFLAKISKNGRFCWAKSLGSNIQEGLIEVDQDYTLHYVGVRLNFDRLNIPYYARYDTSGALLSTPLLNTITPNADNFELEVYDLIVDAEQNLYLLFRCAGFDNQIQFGDGSVLRVGQDSYDTPYLVLQKFNAQLQFQWKVTGRVDIRDTQLKLAVAPQGRLILGGYFTKEIRLNDQITTINDDNTPDIFAASIDSTGRVEWQKSYGNSNSADYANQVYTDRQGNIYLVGTLPFGDFAFDGLQAQVLFSDPFLLKLNPRGQATRVLNLPINTLSAAGRDLQITPSGDIILLGQYRNTGSIGPFKLPPTVVSTWSFFLATIAPDNQIKSLLTTTGENSLIEFTAGRLLLQGQDLYLAGLFTSFAQLGNRQLVNPSFNTCGNCYDGFLAKLRLELATSLVQPITPAPEWFNVFPNPSAGALYLEVRSLASAAPLELAIYDQLGRLVEQIRPMASGELRPIHLNRGTYWVVGSRGVQVQKELVVVE